MNPYSELIRVVQESASDLVEHQMTRDRQRFLYEKHKLALLITLLLTLWIMFFLLWEKLDERQPTEAAPTSPTYYVV
jgi:lipopolysaccharide export system protein LptC